MKGKRLYYMYNNIINNLYAKLIRINDLKTLKESELKTFANYEAAKQCFRDLTSKGSAKTFIEDVARFYVKSGFIVVLDKNNCNYLISAEVK